MLTSQMREPEFRREVQYPLPIWHQLGCPGPMGVLPCNSIGAFLGERDRISDLRAAGRSIDSIAKALGRQ